MICRRFGDSGEVRRSPIQIVDPRPDVIDDVDEIAKYYEAVARVGIAVGGGANGKADKANGAPQYCQTNSRQRAPDL